MIWCIFRKREAAGAFSGKECPKTPNSTHLHTSTYVAKYTTYDCAYLVSYSSYYGAVLIHTCIPYNLMENINVSNVTIQMRVPVYQYQMRVYQYHKWWGPIFRILILLNVAGISKRGGFKKYIVYL
jgi:hypothetical protein